MLDDIGQLPYALARPILLKVDNPEKLVRILIQIAPMYTRMAANTEVYTSALH